MKRLNNKGHYKKGVVYKKFWSLVCCYIGANVSESGKMNTCDIYKTCAGMISEAMPSMLLRANLWNDIFKYWTPSREISKAQFPHGFVDWIASAKKEVSIPKTFVEGGLAHQGRSRRII